MTICQQLKTIQQAITEVEKNCQRQPGEVKLLAVSKGQSLEKIREAFACGQRNFAENYLQEALKKMEQLSELAICWHFIGPMQTNKLKAIAQHFDWVHSVDRLDSAEQLNRHRPPQHTPLQFCLQVNLSGETSKSGVSLAQAYELAGQLDKLPRLQFRGLMTIPPAQAKSAQLFRFFSELQALLQELNQKHRLNLDTLSMGMSHDFREAIQAGSTLVRIGQAIFGERQKR